MADFDPDPLDDMETSLVDDYQAEAREARDRGDHARAAELDAEAARLYRVQNTGTADPYGIEPDTAEADGAEPPDTSDDTKPSDIEAVAGASGLDDYVPWNRLTEDEQDGEFERAVRRADPDFARRELRVTWPGSDFDQNVQFAGAALKAIPNASGLVRALEAVGLADHPEFIKAAASVGRLLAKVPGDPTTITTTSREGKRMTNTTVIEQSIRDMDKAMDKARVEGDRAELGRLYQAQQGLYRKLPGGDTPAVGSSGGPTA